MTRAWRPDAYALDDTEAGHNERLIAGAIAELGAGGRVELVTNRRTW